MERREIFLQLHAGCGQTWDLDFSRKIITEREAKKQITVMKVFMRLPQIKTVIFSDA